MEGEVRRDGGIGRASAAGAGSGERAAAEAAGGDDAGQRHAEGRQRKKVVTPPAKREAVAYLRKTHGVSERRACRALGITRALVRYRFTRPLDTALRERLRALAGQRRRFGYRRLAILLTREGFMCNIKKIRRLYREEQLLLTRRKGRKKATGTRQPLPRPDNINQVWSLDFLSDALVDGRRFRCWVSWISARANVWRWSPIPRSAECG